MASTPERYGDYIYFANQKEPEKNSGMHGYDVYMRRQADPFMSQHDEVVLDMVEIPFLSRHDLKTAVVSKIKMNDGHTHVAFTIDVSNSEVLTGGVKDLQTGTVLPLKLENIG